MAHTDLKEKFELGVLPTPVQMSDTGGSTVHNATAAPLDEWAARPHNHINISRMFGALKRSRFTVDPNLRIPSTLLWAPTWERHDTDVAPAILKRNARLDVTFGDVEADIHVLPRTGPRCPDGESVGHKEPCKCPRRSVLEATSTTGNIALRIETLSTAHFALGAYSTFGRIRIFLPRTFHGPLTVIGTAYVSSGLRRASTTISEDDQDKDKALLGSTFGCVWVGYVGEEAEAKQALRWGMLQWAWALMWVLILLLVMRVSSKFLGWIVGLLLRIALGVKDVANGYSFHSVLASRPRLFASLTIPVQAAKCPLLMRLAAGTVGLESPSSMPFSVLHAYVVL
ncbi:hypothetical protein B0H13DRAFT_2660873 [Mycena leptocephala]|nr:hypothetical protein B0H13DRAFT_2660873 [Mycena leptocephala]